jgi:2,3-bisphosphoglycerate-dependent phosphoglycerate mutase
MIGELLMYLVRHALVDLDIEEKIRGTQNVPLNQEGEEEAMELADFFKQKPIAAVYSDDLDRTYHTAIAIAEPHDLHVHKDVLLRSWDVGSDLEGKSIESNKATIKELKLQPDLIPTGGESWGHAEARAAETLEKYTRIALSSPAPIVVVLHGSLLQLLWRMMGQEETDGHGYDTTPIEPSGVIAVYMTRYGYKTRILREKKVALDA